MENVQPIDAPSSSLFLSLRTQDIHNLQSCPNRVFVFVFLEASHNCSSHCQRRPHSFHSDRDGPQIRKSTPGPAIASPKKCGDSSVASAGPEIGALGLFGAARASQRGLLVRPQKSLPMEIWKTKTWGHLHDSNEPSTAFLGTDSVDLTQVRPPVPAVRTEYFRMQLFFYGLHFLR